MADVDVFVVFLLLVATVTMILHRFVQLLFFSLVVFFGIVRYAVIEILILLVGLSVKTTMIRSLITLLLLVVDLLPRFFGFFSRIADLHL